MIWVERLHDWSSWKLRIHDVSSIQIVHCNNYSLSNITHANDDCVKTMDRRNKEHPQKKIIELMWKFAVKRIFPPESVCGNLHSHSMIFFSGCILHQYCRQMHPWTRSWILCKLNYIHQDIVAQYSNLDWPSW